VGEGGADAPPPPTPLSTPILMDLFPGGARAPLPPLDPSLGKILREATGLTRPGMCNCRHPGSVIVVAGAGAVFGRALFAEQLVGGGTEHIGELGEIIRTQGRGASFPSSISLLGNAELLGNLHLRKSGALADRHQALTELGTF